MIADKYIFSRSGGWQGGGEQHEAEEGRGDGDDGGGTR